MGFGLLAAALAVSWLGSTDAPDPEESDEANLEDILRSSPIRHTGDLAEIKARGLLRVLTRNNSSHYFVFRGEQWGFQYELAKHLADQLGVRLQMVVPADRDSLTAALLAGEGDIIAAGMSITAGRERKVVFSPTVTQVQRFVVTHEDIVKPLATPSDLSRFVLHLNFRSTTFGMAEAFQRRLGLPLLVEDVPPEVEMEEMLRRIGVGDYEATIVDEDLLQLEQAAGTPVVARLPIGGPIQKGWAFRPSSTELAAQTSAFIEKHQKDGLIRIIYGKYFAPETRLARHARDFEFRADEDGRISPYDELFRAAGEDTGIDWRLLAALAYSESRFDPTVRSRFGAVGLMQVLPSTAKQQKDVKLPKNLERAMLDPAFNIPLGAKYLKWLMARFERAGVSKKQQIRFALAAYNAGVGHVLDARELAHETGRDPNLWFGNVEQAMLLKKDRKWHKKTRFGFCRADQVIAYVSRIQTRYDVYVRHVPFN